MAPRDSSPSVPSQLPRVTLPRSSPPSGALPPPSPPLGPARAGLLTLPARCHTHCSRVPSADGAKPSSLGLPLRDRSAAPTPPPPPPPPLQPAPEFIPLRAREGCWGRHRDEAGTERTRGWAPLGGGRPTSLLLLAPTCSARLWS